MKSTTPLRILMITALCIGTMDALAAPQQNLSAMDNSPADLSSGTSLEPRSTSNSTPMIHGSIKGWLLMFHANAFITDIQQDQRKGRDKLFSSNWLMAEMQRQSGRQKLSFRTMLSAEPLTITKRQYPLLFQTGETAYGFSIVNGQHPHDLIMELAGRYDFNLSERSQIFVYGGPVGDAALGPVAFPHRASASENPLSPLGHHQQDSTHIASNVITVGLSEGPVQVEASTFHGREPDENRWNIDSGKPDSFAMRVSAVAGRNLSLQVSSGRLNNPESVDPTLDTVRTTASLHYNLEFSSGHLATSLIWGRNKDLKNGARRIFNTYNAEATVNFKKRNWLWTRLENVDRDRTLLPPPPPTVIVCPFSFPKPLCQKLGYLPAGSTVNGTTAMSHIILGPQGPVFIEEEPIGRVQAYTLGCERELPGGPSWLNAGLGIQATLYRMTEQLREVYGNRPATIAVFLRLRPAGHPMQPMDSMPHP